MRACGAVWVGGWCSLWRARRAPHCPDPRSPNSTTRTAAAYLVAARCSHIGRSPIEAAPGQLGVPTVRPTDPDFAAGHEVAFADGFPLLLARRENLADLNSRLESPLPMNRFRPNIVLSGGGAAPWADDAWRQLGFGSSETGVAGVQVQLCKPCSRCKVTTIDQATAEEGKEPLVTLRKFRCVECMPASGSGWHRAGDVGWSHAHQPLTPRRLPLPPFHPPAGPRPAC